VKNKTKLVNGFIISTFVSLYLMVSIISTIHVIDFFKLSNPTWLAITLAIAFEVGAAASLASLIAMDKMNKTLVWFLFILLTAMQAMGNTYYAFINLQDFSSWSELFGLIEEEEIFQKRILSLVSGAILPIVALGFIKSLVDYIKPAATEDEEVLEENMVDENPDDELFDLDPSAMPNAFDDISEPLVHDESLEMIKDTPASEVKSEEIKTPISKDKVEIVNVNANKKGVKRVDMPTDPDINPMRL